MKNQCIFPNHHQSCIQAKNLKKLLQSDNEAKALLAAERFFALPEYSGKTASQILAISPRLAKCQHVIAKEHGYDSWQDIKKCPSPELALQRVISENHALTDWGLFTYANKKQGLDRERGRDILAKEVNEFRLCCMWLSKCKLIKTPNEKIGSSYGLKHRVERWAETYISNGTFIAAVFYLGIPYKDFFNSPNINVAISSRCKNLKKSHRSH